MGKRIIFTVTNDLNFDRRMHRICSALHTNGYDVVLVGRKRKNSLPLDSKAFTQKRLFCFFQKGKLFYLEYNLRLLFYLILSSSDVICAVDLDTLVPCFYASKMRRSKLVYDAHEWFSEVPEVVRRPKIKAIWEYVAKKFIHKVDLSYTVGPELARILSKEYNTLFTYVLNVPNKKEIVVTDELDQHIILYQGALNEGRGLEVAIEAMKGIDGVLWLVGEGDLSKDLRALTTTLQLENKVRFFGMVSPEKLLKLTLQAVLGLNLLENKSKSYYYSLANKFFDYMHAGVPSINMAFPEYHAILSEFPCGIQLEELTVDGVIEVVNFVLHDKEKLKEMKRYSLEASNKYNWDIESQKVIQLYDALF